MTGVWRCPDCAEDVAAGVKTCPYCGYAAVGGPPSPATAGTAAATRMARYGHCPSCGRSEWEGGVTGRCVACGAELQSLQVVEVPLATGGERQRASAATKPQRLAVATAAGTGAVESPAPHKLTAAPRGVATDGAAAKKENPGAGLNEAPTGAAADAIALLRQLAALRDEGIITSEEFEAKKAEVLRRL